MEHRRVRLIRITPVYPTGRDDSNRHALFHHRANLDRRRVGTQQVSAREVERVVHCSCRMIVGDIQSREVVEIVFDLRTGPDPEAGIAKDALDARHRPGYRVPTAPVQAPPVEGDIDCVRRQFLFERRTLQRIAPRLDFGVNGLLGLIDSLASGRTLFGGQLSQRLHQGGQFALLAEIGDANGVERSQIGRLGYIGRCP